MSNITLYGMKHTGKSTLAQKLAIKLGGVFYDLDDLIEGLDPAKRPVRQLYRESGKSVFEQFEQGAAAKLSDIMAVSDNCIAALGGGTGTKTDIMDRLSRVSTRILITEKAEILFERIRQGGLPPFLETDDPYGSFLQLYTERTECFVTYADIHLDLDGRNIEQAYVYLIQKIEEYERGRK